MWWDFGNKYKDVGFPTLQPVYILQIPSKEQKKAFMSIIGLWDSSPM